MEEYSYTSTLPLGHTGPVTGSLYIYLLHNNITDIPILKTLHSDDIEKQIKMEM